MWSENDELSIFKARTTVLNCIRSLVYHIDNEERLLGWFLAFSHNFWGVDTSKPVCDNSFAGDSMSSKMRSYQEFLKSTTAATIKKIRWGITWHHSWPWSKFDFSLSYTHHLDFITQVKVFRLSLCRIGGCDMQSK